jgi:succinate-acetate transporter protein
MSTKIKEIEDLEVGVETKIMQVPVETSTPVIHRFNAMPLAFSGFAVASVLLGFVSTGLITDVNVVGVGACIASAGLGLLIASISELLKGM